MTDELETLMKLARAAPPGRWRFRRSDFGNGPEQDYAYVEWGKLDSGYGTGTLDVPTARYIAAVSPEVVLPLLARLDDAEARVTALREALEEARASIEAMSGDAADLIDVMDEAAALRTALAHVLVRTHDSGCGVCDAARALLAEPLEATDER